MKILMTSLILLLMTKCGLAVLIRHDVDPEIYLRIGDEHPEVGYWGDVESGPNCSAVLVTPTKVLTAAHCLPSEVLGPDGTVGSEFGAASFFRLGPFPKEDETLTPNIAHMAVHPKYDNGAGLAHDIAVLTLSDPIQNVALPTVSLANPDGLVGTFVGYGFWGDGQKGIDGDIVAVETEDGPDFDVLNPANGRRGARNRLHVVEPEDAGFLDFNDRFISYDFDSPLGDHYNHYSDDILPDEGAGTFGDSGAPIYAMFASGTYIVGITSGGSLPPELLPNVSDLTELDPDLNLNEFVGVYGEVGGYAMLGLESNAAFLNANGIPAIVPENNSTLIAGVASCVLLVSYRRRNRDAIRLGRSQLRHG